MPLSRRDLIRSGFVVGGAVALGGRPGSAWAASYPTNPAGTTLAQTLLKGPPGTLGYRHIVPGAGEPHFMRNDLDAPTAAPGTRTPLVAFAHLTDVHVIDAQSPARVEYVDRFEDQYSDSDPVIGLLTSSYRPQEMLTSQVAESMVQRVRAVASGAPASGRPLDFTIQTGDNSDNCQLNETRWNIDLLDGGKVVTPDSGKLGTYEGVADRKNYDPHYWHPEPGPANKQDIYHTDFGFHDVPGLLAAAIRPFASTGLGMPWYSVFGNHDGLVQGNFPKTLPLSAVAMGSLKISSVPPGVSQADAVRALKSVDAAPLLGATALKSATPVSSDKSRKVINRKQTVTEHFTTTGTPVGHGYTATNRLNGTAYYTFTSGNVLGIVLDTVNPNGYAEGSIDQQQFNWLKQRLATSTDKFVIIFSHHTIATMTNPLVLTGLDPRPRVLGAAVKTELLKHPNVVAWVNGHTHTNEVIAHKPPSGAGGFWEINSASHVDFPQQSRTVELVDNGNGTLSIFCTMLDHVGPTSYSPSLSNPAQLSALARELAANDPQERGGITAVRDGRRGTLADRNVELLVANALA
ncbi:TIGR03767 family metallophosphoesterase [Aeromicrobium sp.]|uniref:TIGR03767 family metallophosphoesterase n=1 Tax=Aeromicrobium sp. TaxID=1871063 RepID=UPI003C53B900